MTPLIFYHAAAEAMRQVLIDHARAKLADKRGGGRRRVPMTEVTNVAALDSTSDPDNVLTLDAAMIRLAELASRSGAGCSAAVLRRLERGKRFNRHRAVRANDQTPLGVRQGMALPASGA